MFSCVQEVAHMIAYMDLCRDLRGSPISGNFLEGSIPQPLQFWLLFSHFCTFQTNLGSWLFDQFYQEICNFSKKCGQILQLLQPGTKFGVGPKIRGRGSSNIFQGGSPSPLNPCMHGCYFCLWQGAKQNLGKKMFWATSTSSFGSIQLWFHLKPSKKWNVG